MEKIIGKTSPQELNAESSLNELVYKQVKQKIIFFEYAPNQFLTESMLAAEYQVSKMPIKLAIRQLENEGWLIADFRRKTRVRGITEADIRSIYDFRSLLEQHTLDLIFPKQLALAYVTRLEQKLVQVQASRNDLQAYLLAERAIHTELIDACENKRISNVYNNLQDEVIRISCLNYISRSTESGAAYTDTAINSWLSLIKQLRCKEYRLAKRQLAEHLELGQYNAILGLQTWQQAKLASKSK